MAENRQAENIIWGIGTALELLSEVIDFVSFRQGKYKCLNEYLFGKTDGRVSKAEISKTVYELKRSNYINYPNANSVILTNKAKMKIIDAMVEKYGKDKKRRLVSFDIPESRRTARNKFRRAIKKMGFAQIQKSLWVTENKVGDLVEAAASEYEVKDFVAYFVVESSNIDSYLSEILADSNG